MFASRLHTKRINRSRLAQHHRILKSQRGFTLPELMIGLSASLAVIAIALSTYHLSRQQLEKTEQLINAELNIQVALRHLQHNAALAAGGFMTLTSEGQAILSQPYRWQDGVVHVQAESTQDTLSLGYWQGYTSTDCVGASQGKTAFIENNFRISAKKELTCKDVLARTSSGYQALADDVLEQRFDLALTQQASSSQLQWMASNAFQPTLSVQVVAIRVCLRVRAPAHLPIHLRASHDCRGNPLDDKAPVQRVIRQVIALPHQTPAPL
jgi:prepilin-type N-terminal cleavage/methylation domain-containing protein